jgi:TPP-dependent pyruvate/acetoin dehydrogenase alpha subunit
MNCKDLIQFEDKIKEVYERGKIKAPIHLSGYGENKIIKIFKKYKITKNDFVFGTWRSHYLWLLSKRSPDELYNKILSGNSMHIYDDNFFTSAIVGGVAPIAIGVAWALKQKKSKNRVFCFLGDMGASTGIAMESIKYATGHDLPILFIIEDNDLSVRAVTSEVWGKCKKNKVITYKYERKFSHAGTGKYIMF